MSNAIMPHLKRLRTYLIGVFLVFAISAQSQTPAVSYTNPLSNRGLDLLPPGSIAFSEILGHLLSEPELKAASPFISRSIIVRNRTEQFVWGFTVVYTYLDERAPSGNLVRYVVNPSPGGAAGRESMLAPGASMLITPIPDFIASMRADGTVTARPNTDQGFDEILKLYQAQHPSSERVQIDVDSLIFESGTIIGPDVMQRMSKINNRIKAERDLVQALSSLRGDQLTAKLKLYSQGNTADEYSTHLKSLAQTIDSIRSQQSEGDALRVLDSIQTAKWFSNSEIVRREQP